VVAHAAAGHATAAAGHDPSHGSLSAALGPSSYELAAEKMSDREILATLAQHLWPKGKQGQSAACLLSMHSQFADHLLKMWMHGGS
jgi:hypothetical protein